MSTDFFVGYGTRAGRVYELDANGLPAASSTSPYTGIKVKGLSGFQTQQTNVRRIAHYDGDRVSITQIFPTLDVPSGTVTIDGADLSLLAILGNVKESTVSGFNVLPIMSDQQGNEPSVGMIITQAAKNDEGVSGYHNLFVNSSQAVPVPGSFGNNNYETTLQLSPSSSSHHLWGMLYTTSADGTESAAGDDTFGTSKAVITSWLSNGIATTYNFDTSLLPVGTSYSVFTATPETGGGVTVAEVTTDITKGSSSIQFTGTGGVADGVLIFALHGVA